MDVLLTGFEPFAGEDTNPSWDAVDAVRPDGYRLTRLRLPCVFGDAIAAVRGALAAHRYDLVVCVGQAGGRAGITPERVAVNLDDARIPDNAGAQPVDEPVVPGGPAAYFTGLPVKACVAALEAEGVPASVSHTAGTFVCNHVFFTALEAAASGTRAGFVHVPWSAEHAPSHEAAVLPLADIVRALDELRIAPEDLAAMDHDPSSAGGVSCVAAPAPAFAQVSPVAQRMAQAAGLAAGSSGLLALLATTMCLVCLVCNSPSGSKGGSGFAVSAMGILAIMTIALTTGKLAADDHVSGTSAQYFTGQPVLMLPNVCSSIVATFKDAPRATWSPDRDIVVNGKSVLEGRAACDQLFNVVQVARL